MCRCLGNLPFWVDSLRRISCSGFLVCHDLADACQRCWYMPSFSKPKSSLLVTSEIRAPYYPWLQVYCLEIEPYMLQLAQPAFQEAGVQDQIEVLVSLGCMNRFQACWAQQG